MKKPQQSKLEFLIKYLGKAATAKRLGYSRMWLYQIEKGEKDGGVIFWIAVDREYSKLKNEMRL
jgi:hypothetical protein